MQHTTKPQKTQSGQPETQENSTVFSVYAVVCKSAFSSFFEDDAMKRGRCVPIPGGGKGTAAGMVLVTVHLVHQRQAQAARPHRARTLETDQMVNSPAPLPAD